MKTYIQIKVPISWDMTWFKQLPRLLSGVNIKWQRQYYHATLAFIDETPHGVDLITGLNRILDQSTAPVITFDKLDAFASGRNRQVIHLTATSIPAPFLAMVDEIRRELKTKGCVIKSDFRLHVTLGRVDDPSVNVRSLQDIISDVEVPPMTFALTDVDYLMLDGHHTISKWTLER